MDGGQDARGLWFLIKALAFLFIVEQGKGKREGEGEGICLCFGQLSGARRQAARARGNERFRIVVEAPLAHESAPPGCPGIPSILDCLLAQDFLDRQQRPALSWKGPVGSSIAFIVLTSGHDCSLN